MHDHHHNHHDHDYPHVHANSEQPPATDHGRQTNAWLKQNRQRILLSLVALYLISGTYYVPADQQAVRIRFGRLIAEREQPGLHYSWPYPLERVIRLKINEAQRLSIGSSDLSRTLGVTTGKEDYLLSGDQNLLRMQAWVQYYIQDPA